ncbi:hypothetical protein NQZ68_020002, partial [Dissostichus eleginoides]
DSRFYVKTSQDHGCGWGWDEGREPKSVPLSDDADGDDPEGEMQAELSGQNWQVQRKLFQ